MSDNISYSFSSLGRKEDGEGGIMFDNEGEKEQWQEDQKVSGTVMNHLCLIETLLFSGEMCVFGREKNPQNSNPCFTAS